MPDSIRFSETDTVLPSLKLNNAYIGTAGGGGYGPTQSTGFWAGIDVPSSGYVIYANKETQGPSIMPCNSKEDVVAKLKNMYPVALSNIYDLQEYYRFPVAVEYAHARNGVIVVNKDYPAVPLQGLICNVDPTYTLSYPRTGSTVYDITGTGNDGTLTDIGWGAELDGCFILNGSTSFINLGADTSLEFGSDDFSVSLWFRMDNNPVESSPVLFSKGVSGSTGIMINIEDNTVAAYVDNSSGNPDLKCTTTVNDNDWHNVVLIRKGDVYQLVLDTFEESNVTLTGRSITTKDNTLIGKYGGNNNYFDGKIGAVQIYNRGLQT